MAVINAREKQFKSLQSGDHRAAGSPVSGHLVRQDM